MSDLDELMDDARNEDRFEDSKFEQDAINIDFDSLVDDVLEAELNREEAPELSLSDGSSVEPENSTDQDILMANERYQEEIARENDEKLNDLVKEAEKVGYVKPDANEEIKQAIERLEEAKGIALTDTLSKSLDVADRMDDTRGTLSNIGRYNDSINEAMDRMEKLEREDLIEREERDKDLEREKEKEEKVVSSKQMSKAVKSIVKK